MQTRNSKLETHACAPKRYSAQERNRLSSGFTLLEVLLAMALLAVISAALYGTYFTLVRGRETATAGMESRRELRTTLDMLQSELSAAFYYKENRKDNKRFFHFVVDDRDFFGKPASTLDFTTISPPRSGNLPLSDQMEVRYRPVEKDGKIVLTRQVRDVYLAAEPLPYPQMEELEGFLVECFDGEKWQKTWNTELKPNLPKAVRVTIRVREGEKTLEFAVIASPKVVPS